MFRSGFWADLAARGSRRKLADRAGGGGEGGGEVSKIKEVVFDDHDESLFFRFEIGGERTKKSSKMVQLINYLPRKQSLEILLSNSEVCIINIEKLLLKLTMLSINSGNVGTKNNYCGLFTFCFTEALSRQLHLAHLKILLWYQTQTSSTIRV